MARGDLDAAQRCFEEMVNIQRKHGTGLVLLVGCNSLGEVAERRGDVNRARALYQEALQLRRDLGAARLGYVHGSLPGSMLSIARWRSPRVTTRRPSYASGRRYRLQGRCETNSS